MTSVLFFAFGFGSPWMLWGLAAASIPIVLHLLNRRRYRETRWAAMRFLLAAMRRNQRRVRLEQWLLLAARTLLLMCLVLAMAQPFLESLGSLPLFAGQRTHRVLVLDGTMSMNSARAGRSLFDSAREFADGYVRNARRGDTFSLILMGSPPRVVIGAPSPNTSEVRRELAELRPAHGAADLPATFARLNEVLEASTIAQKEVVFVSDLQAATWKPADPKADDLTAALAKLESKRASSLLVDVGDARATNHAVTDLRLDTPVVVRGGPRPLVSATVRHFGASTERDLPVRLLVDGRLGPEQAVDVPPGEDVVVSFATGFEAPGDHVVEVRVADDALAVDNARRLAVPVRESIRVLLVDGDTKSDAFGSETDYLAQALSPSAGSDQSPNLVETDVTPEAQLGRTDLSRYDVVILCNLGQVSAPEIEALSAHVRQGGGLVIFAGDRVESETTNRLLFAEGKGLAPASIQSSVGDPAATATSSVEFDPRGFAHPIVKPYEGASDAVLSGLIDVKTFKYQKLAVPEGSQARVALGFTSGDAAIVDAPFGRGRVIQVATTADADWTSWPLHPSYPPILEQIVLHAASGRQAARNVGVGEAFEQEFPASSLGSPATVEVPDGRILPGKLDRAGEGARLSFDSTELSGSYLAKLGPPASVDLTFAVNPPAIESDPARLDEAGLREAIPGWRFAVIDSRGKANEPPDGTVTRQGELHRYLLGAVLALLLIESFLAWRFGHQKQG